MLSWRWWARARGTQLVLLGSIALSLGAALMTSTAYGGEAVGFRHGVYLMPACLVLLLPWIAPGEGQRRFTPVVVTIAAISAAMMLVFAVRNPWSELTITNAPVGTWRDYVPIVYKVASGTLFKP
jgi:hypothetical protein